MVQTIDNFDKSVYDLFAVRTELLEEIYRELRLDQAASIPKHTHIEYLNPILAQLDILLGIIPRYAPWALFLPPKKKWVVRRRPFGFFRIAPSLGTLEEQEQLEMRLAKYECRDHDEKKEKEVLQNCFKVINKINGWMGHIIGRMGQLLQG